VDRYQAFRLFVQSKVDEGASGVSMASLRLSFVQQQRQQQMARKSRPALAGTMLGMQFMRTGGATGLNAVVHALSASGASPSKGRSTHAFRDLIAQVRHRQAPQQKQQPGSQEGAGAADATGKKERTPTAGHLVGDGQEAVGADVVPSEQDGPRELHQQVDALRPGPSQHVVSVREEQVGGSDQVPAEQNQHGADAGTCPSHGISVDEEDAEHDSNIDLDEW
jgi:hypothetical protein